MNLAVHAFEKARSLDAYEAKDRHADIDMNYYSVIAPGDAIEILSTKHTANCSGWAVLSQEEDACAGIIHIYADPSFYAAGEAAVRAHTRKAWAAFETALSEKTTASFSAVCFGGWKTDVVETLKDPDKAIEEYNRIATTLREIRRSDEYQALDSRASEIWYSDERDIVEWERITNARGALTKDGDAYMRSPKANQVVEYESSMVSLWISDEAYKAATTSNMIHVDVTADFRFQPGPHDAFVDRKEQYISVGRSDDKIIKGTITKTPEKQGTRLFKTLRIEA